MYQYFNYNNNFVSLQSKIINLYHCNVIYDSSNAVNYNIITHNIITIITKIHN